MLTRLFVLALLTRQPLSGYEIQRYLLLNRMEQWAGILPGSIHHALKQLEKDGLIALQAVTQAGHRTRAIYAISPAGSNTYQQLLREAWRSPTLHFPALLYAAASFLDDLPREDVLQAIDDQIAALHRQVERWNAGQAAKSAFAPAEALDYLGALFDHGREHLEADLRLLRALRRTIPTLPQLPPPLPLLPPEESA